MLHPNVRVVIRVVVESIEGILLNITLSPCLLLTLQLSQLLYDDYVVVFVYNDSLRAVFLLCHECEVSRQYRTCNVEADFIDFPSDANRLNIFIRK